MKTFRLFICCMTLILILTACTESSSHDTSKSIEISSTAPTESLDASAPDVDNNTLDLKDAYALIEAGKYEEAYRLLYNSERTEEVNALLQCFKINNSKYKKTFRDGSYEIDENQYDNKGNKSKTTCISYDSEGNVTKSYTIQFWYDESGNVIKLVHTDESSTTTQEWTYYKDDMPLSYTKTSPKGTESAVIEYNKFDKIVHRTRINLDGTIETVDHIYDIYGNILESVSIKNDKRETIVYTNDEYGNQIMIEANFANGDHEVITYEYDENHLPIRCTATFNGKFARKEEITYDENGDTIGRTATYPDYTYSEVNEKTENGSCKKCIYNFQDGTQSYDETHYDSEGREVKNVRTERNGTYRETIYTFDEYGNRTLYKEVQNGEVTICNKNEYTYDKYGNMLTKVLTYVDGARTTTIYTYDDCGNLLKEIITDEEDGKQPETVSYERSDYLYFYIPIE